jgi:hypothetical protein
MTYYKGFKHDLTCRGFQYKVGEIYCYDGNISLCNAGFHYCDSLSKVFDFYSRSNKVNNPYANKFAIVQPLGNVKGDNNKSVTNKLQIVKVLTEEEILDILYEEYKETRKNDVFYLDIIKELQSVYHCHVGGSIALFIQGYELNRGKHSIDIDLILPYYQRIRKEDFKNSKVIKNIIETKDRTSGSDFSNTLLIQTVKGPSIKVDICISSTQKYDVVEFDGFNYKVNDVFTIMEAKCRYAMKGNEKHQKDIIHLMKNKKQSKNNFNSLDPFEQILPF